MQFLLTKGLAHGDKKGGARATNMIYTNMLFALALDKLVFGSSPGWWSLGGSGLILGSAVWVALQRGRVEGVGEMGERGRERDWDGEGVEEERRGMLGGDQDDGVEERGNGDGGVQLQELDARDDNQPREGV